MEEPGNLVDECFAFACGLAKKVGPIIKSAFYAEKVVDIKSCTTDLVTATDQEVEKILLNDICTAYPTHQFIGEESVASSGTNKCTLTDDPTWIIDPIDGTTNFVHKFPYVAVCIGFVYCKRREFGVVYNPILDEMFVAKRGAGAFLNDMKLSVSEQRQLCKSLVMTECGSSRDAEQTDKVFRNMKSVLNAPVHAIHSLGSAALDICMVARGSAEAYYEFGIHCWDFCAASIIVEEAGGAVLDTEGGAFDLMRRRIVAANNLNVAKDLCKFIVEQIEFLPDE